MKKSLLALALFAFVGTTAFAHDGDGKTTKNGKKTAACSAEAKAHCSGTGATAGAMPSCCMKKGMKTAATTTPVVTPAVKSL